MRREHPFDRRRARTALEPVDDALVLHQRERRDDVDLEAFRQLRPLVHVDPHDAHALALLALDVREQALHPARRPRLHGAEEDEQGLGSVGHYELNFSRLRTRRNRSADAYTGPVLGDLYWIGVSAGVGAGVGVLLAGLLNATPLGRVAGIVLAAAAGVLFGLLVDNLDEAVGGGIGGILGAFAAATIALGTLRRGGTRGGTAALFGLGGIAVAALAFVPALGYVEALGLPALAARLRQRGGERYAGLRILARD